jgi:DNA-directed RNA polymerase subunit L
MRPALVASVTIVREELTAENVPELRELFGLKSLPFAPAKVEVELKNVPTAVANALRRAVLDEMPGHALQVPKGGYRVEESTDPFMLPTFVCPRIAMIPLRPQISAETIANLRLELVAKNESPCTVKIYSGDLASMTGEMPAALFNPTFALAELQPGKQLTIKDIQIATGYGRDDAVFHVTRRAAHRHLDLEQYEEAEMHEEKGAAADLSGYKVSCTVANPRHHLVCATVPAVSSDLNEAKIVFADACANIKERLRLIAASVGRNPADQGSSGHRGVQYSQVQLEAGLFEGVLQVPGETATIGELIRRVIYELTPEIAFVNFLVIAHENKMRLTVRHSEDVTSIISSAVRQAVSLFDEIQRGILAAKV